MINCPRALKALSVAGGMVGGAIFTGCGGGGGASASVPLGSASSNPPPPPGTCLAPAKTALSVNVMDAAYGAKADGITNDGPAIQKAIDYIASKGGGTVTVPAGTYGVDPTWNYSAGILLGNHVTLILDAAAILQALPTSTSSYVVLQIKNVHDVNVHGGTVVGNRKNNTITDAIEAGTGIQIVNSQNVVVEEVNAKDCWADGFYVGGNSAGITLCKVVADNNRRNGMSLTSVTGILVSGCTFKNATGFLENGQQAGGSGVDIEPNLGETVANVLFTGCTFSSNAGEGLILGPSIANTGKAFVTNVTVDGNKASGNGTNGSGSGIEISNTTGHKVKNNTVSDNIGDGIYLRNNANGNLVTGNTVSRTLAAPLPGDIGYGILLYKTQGNTVTGNILANNAACGVRDSTPTTPGTANDIISNTLTSNGTCPP